MIDNILFFIIFLVQILTVSYFWPMQICKRMEFVLQNFKPEEYPKLYVDPIEVYQKGNKRVQAISLVITAIGFVLFGMLLHFDYSNDKDIPEIIPAIYFLFQGIPVVLIEFSGYGQLKKMREANKSSIKKANFKPRGIFDFVSRLKVAVTLILFASLCLLTSYYANFDMSIDARALPNMLTIFGTNLFFVFIIWFNLRGKKLNPHQDSVDRMNDIRVTINTLFNISISVSIFIMIIDTARQFDFRQYEALLMTTYLVSIGLLSMGTLLKNLKIEKVNFEVYKA